ALFGEARVGKALIGEALIGPKVGVAEILIREALLCEARIPAVQTWEAGIAKVLVPEGLAWEGLTAAIVRIGKILRCCGLDILEARRTDLLTRTAIGLRLEVGSLVARRCGLQV